jgi:hypothetical protein
LHSLTLFIFRFAAVNGLNGIVNERDALLQYLRKGALSPPPGLDNLTAASLVNLLNMSGGLDNGRHDLKPQSFVPNNGHAGHAQTSVTETEAILSALAGSQTNEALQLLLQNSLRGQLTSALMKAGETPLVQVGQSTSNCALPVATPSAPIPNNVHVHGNTGPGYSQAPLLTAQPLPMHNLASSSISNGMHQQVLVENPVNRVDQFQRELLQGQVTPLETVQKFYATAQPTEARGSGQVQFTRNVHGDRAATDSTSDLEAPQSTLAYYNGKDPRSIQDSASHQTRPAVHFQQPPRQHDTSEGSPSGSDQSPTRSYADWQVGTAMKCESLAKPVVVIKVLQAFNIMC